MPKTTDKVEQIAKRVEESETISVRPPEDVKRLMAKAIRDCGQNPSFWIFECLRSGLAKYAGKKDNPPSEWFIKSTR